MSRSTPAETEQLRVFQHVIQCGAGAPPLDEKVLMLQMLRAEKAAGQKVDRLLLEEIERLRLGLEQVQGTQGELRELLKTLREAPWHPATFLGMAEIGGIEAALVMQGNTKRAVAISEDFDPDGLEPGDEILLGNQMNLAVARSPIQSFRSGETAVFERWLPDGRLVIRHRDEEVVVEASGSLTSSELKAGDRIRWDRAGWIAYEKVPRSESRHLFLEETPDDTFEEIGGLDREIGQIRQTIQLHMYRQDIVQKYHARRRGSVLLAGPPGNGKTKIARALANWMASLAKSGRSHFVNIKPGAMNSMWFGQTEANYREAFRAAREASESERDVPVVVFIDEIDSIGSARGAALTRVDDRVQTAFMAELDGFEGRGNVIVVAATNRRDALDPALLRPGRLGDLIIEIPRPGRKAAAAIFDRYLRPDIPYAVNGRADAEAARLEIVETALSRIYAPNADNRLATLTFRDGKQMQVTAKDLISGASISNIVHAAVERACFREAESGACGVRVGDVLDAIHEEFRTASRALTPSNCHKHLSNLPQDVDVVRVDLTERGGPKHRYRATA